MEPVATVRPAKMPRWTWFAAGALAILVAGLLSGVHWLRPSDVERSSPASARGGVPATPDVPRLLVRPFEDLSGTPSSAIIAKGLTEEVISQIVKFKDIVVVKDWSRSRSNEEATSRNSARYALEGSVQLRGDKLRVASRLVNRADGTVVWADTHDGHLQVRDFLEAETEIARKVATVLAQPYGIIFRADAMQVVKTPPVDWEAYACTLAYYAYRVDLKPETHGSVRECLEQAVERFPTYATAWALLSLTYIDELRFRYTVDAIATPPSTALWQRRAGRSNLTRTTCAVSRRR
jgi:TolB-like protein